MNLKQKKEKSGVLLLHSKMSAQCISLKWRKFEHPVCTFKVIIVSDNTDSIKENILWCCSTKWEVAFHKETSLQKLISLNKHHLQG